MDQNAAKQAAQYLINLNLETIIFILGVLIAVAIPIYRWVFSNTAKEKKKKNHCPPEMIKSMESTNLSISAMNAKIDNVNMLLKDAVIATAEISGALKALIEINKD